MAPTDSGAGAALRRSMLRTLLVAGAVVFGAQSATVRAQALDAHKQLARDIFKQLVEINTVTATGDTLEAAQAMADRLKAAGFDAADVRVLSPAPRKGNLVARMRGSGQRRPILLLAHIDVVAASASDWSAEPFKLLEKDGWFYGRGVIDNKFMASALVANLIRYKQEGFKPDRDLILVLETDEEILDANSMGIRWLLANHRELIDAEFALNEGAGVGLLNGKPLANYVQTSEKVAQSFQLQVRNPGGHSSLPTKDNAIYRLADGLAKLARYDFPVQLNDTTREFFRRSAEVADPELGKDMRGAIATPPDAAAVARLSSSAQLNAQLRTTCVATLLSAGTVANALPQTARATVNCRILPGEPVDEVHKTLERVVADEQIAVTKIGSAVLSPPSPLNPQLMRAVERLTAEFWPGIPVVPIMIGGATDGSFLRNAGIPTYGHSGLAGDVNDNRLHGKDERVLVKSYFDGLEYLYRLVKALSSQGN
jgi:acetylornithine deacetylase/succinyl-diaminopimelate desuccinylase-like protein